MTNATRRAFAPLRLGLILAAIAPGAASAQDTSSALYEVTFDAVWSAKTHPGAYPLQAHFSPLIGATHSSAVTFWEVGGLASGGMERMAELGSTTNLTLEIVAAVGAGTAGSSFLGAGQFSPGEVVTTFTVTEDHPLLTLVSMIAPSPDWFVGTQSLSLMQDGQWVDDLVHDLYAYDAGTDSGTAFNSPNQNTSPADPISLMTGGPFFGTVPLGTFTFRRLKSTLVYGSGLNPAGSLSFNTLPTVGQDFVLSLHDPTGQMSTPATTIVASTATPNPLFPTGVSIANVGLAGPGAAGEFLIGGPIAAIQYGAGWTGTPDPVTIPIPNDPGLASQRFYLQGILLDPSPRFGLTEAIELVIGL